jgi:S-adenosylmethionine synthetase
LHHNVDKVLLCGGASRPAFGGGEVLEPIEIYLAGRAMQEHQGERVPIHEIAIDACREWLRRHLRQLDPERHVRIFSRLRAGSSDLTGLFVRGSGRALANDTSCGVGFAPFSDLEKVVLGIERHLNASETKTSHPELGEDIKVMGVRRGRHVDVTIGCALVGRFVSSPADYVAKKSRATELAIRAARAVTDLDLDIRVNVGDDVERGELFLTVTGTSAEAGDDGEVGRGNRVSGLITPYRSMTLEAAAGKNPVTHVGKLYNVLAARIAAAVTAELSQVCDATCIMVSKIGSPVDDPHVVDIELQRHDGGDCSEHRDAVEQITRSQLAEIEAVRNELLSERLSVY